MNYWLIYVGFCVIWAYFAVTSFNAKLSMLDVLALTFLCGIIMMFLLPIIPALLIMEHIVKDRMKNNG